MDGGSPYIHKCDDMFERDKSETLSFTALDTYHDNVTIIAQALQEAGCSMSIFSKDTSLKKFLRICANNGIVLDAVYDKRLKHR